MKKTHSAVFSALLFTALFFCYHAVGAQSLMVPKSGTLVTTSEQGNSRLKETGKFAFKADAQPVETDVCVFVDPAKTFQTLVGIGGALTDASAETFAKLNQAKQKEILDAFYNPATGIGYSLGRTNIASCDFSSGTYSYVEDNDLELKTFSLKHDEKYKIPLIKQAIAAAGGSLTLFVSPWSPPAWMKDNKNVLKGGKLLPEFRQSWANHYIKFINEFEKQGIPVWGLSVQNEPMATQTWESCIYSAEDERDFVKLFLGPTLEKAGLGSKKLIVWDHNRDLIYQRASVMLDDPEAAKYVWGVGYHWYETWTKSGMLFDNVRRVKEAYPNKELIFTEGCVEKFDFKKINDWSLGERYGYSMINDFNNGTAAWTDWNILLDEKGGPNHVGNFCYAPVIADTRDGSLHYTNIFYYIGHFSKFIRPGAKRVAVTTNRDDLLATGFVNADGKLVVVVMNKTDKKIGFKLWIKGQAASIECEAHSISSLLLD